ncbi:sigma-70 family RNA polymerase sigma factor [Alkalicoccobacillus porphyridii]|nr:sigma-70 family RNA polymerase sigma factor [Alkalicoccobacillus porphyridii]
MMTLIFDEVLQQYTPLIKGQIKKLRLTQNYDEYYQVGVIALWDAFRRFEPEKGEFAAYAKLRVRGELISSLRKELVHSERYLLTSESTEHLLEHETAEMMDLTADFSFTPFLQNLSAREWLYVEQILILGKSRKAVAEEQGVSLHTVSSWSKTARRKLRQAGQAIGDPRKME